MHGPSDFEDNIHLAEASAWLARLQGPLRDTTVENAFKAWLAESPAHARAYARVADIWEIIPGGARLNQNAGTSRSRMHHARRRVLRLAASACILATLTVASWVWIRPNASVYQTEKGEVEVIELHDGTWVTLDTDTRLIVAYGKHERRVHLEHGGAIFQDAADPQRPFVVDASGHRVQALGTIFQVRINPESLAVTLIKGKVAVSGHLPKGAHGPFDASTILSPGERLTLWSRGRTTLDYPSIEALTAWRRGELVFNNVTFVHAVDEINRYGGTPVHLGDSALANKRVSGVFTTHDPAEFANAVAKLYHLHVVRTDKSIKIVR